MTYHSTYQRTPNFGPTLPVEANGATAVWPRACCMKEVEQPAEEGSSWAYHLAGMGEQPNQGLQLLQLTGFPRAPLPEQSPQPLQLLNRKSQFPSDGVNLDAQKNEACRGAVPLVGCHRYP